MPPINLQSFFIGFLFTVIPTLTVSAYAANNNFNDFEISGKEALEMMKGMGMDKQVINNMDPDVLEAQIKKLMKSGVIDNMMKQFGGVEGIKGMFGRGDDGEKEGGEAEEERWAKEL
ncbi:hypothetical protein EJ08DRAFT_693768 [Tothia fuscella]|uniref:Uncharacterized protein n=1 Tax=Tothia fuscella TaxID=1048955 RepID=A0A9P4U260_9PEZI|nr:hypothetical protein EJ08DRAFT_693768 [Tothia fuscella]